MQRSRVAVLVLVVSVAVSGCLLGGDRSLSADPATVDDAALNATGYETVNVSDAVVTRTVSIAGTNRTVRITNVLATYNRSVDAAGMSGGAATFRVFSSPTVTVLGEEFNPIRNASPREVVSRIGTSGGSVSVGERVGSRNVTVLGTATNVTTYEGRAGAAPATVGVHVQVTEVVEHEGDYVVAVAVHPRRLDGESDRVVRLLSGLEHPGERPGDRQS